MTRAIFARDIVQWITPGVRDQRCVYRLGRLRAEDHGREAFAKYEEALKYAPSWTTLH
jgi:hypothetical protein